MKRTREVSAAPGSSQSFRHTRVRAARGGLVTLFALGALVAAPNTAFAAGGPSGVPGAGTNTGSPTVPDPQGVAEAQQELAARNPNSIGGAGTTADDPTTIGTGQYWIADYNFGTESIPLANIGGIRGEVEGRIYLPRDPGPHPLVVFLHGKTDSCFKVGSEEPTLDWPCPPGTQPILSYAGYDGAGEALAKDGFTVVSISANAITAKDDDLSPDNGYSTRGQLVLDTLTMLEKANAGEPVVFHDAATGKDVSLQQALIAGHQTYPNGTLTAASLVNSIDFGSIGLMGHSRGGEGVAMAANLNEGLAHPWNIKAIFALAPTDFTRTTVPDVPMTTLLPYCDGDVFDQQGQHFYADSRHAFEDNVLRSDLWVMGADHNFFNTQWSPPAPAGVDDWSDPADPVCGTSTDALKSGHNIRLSQPQQYQLGSAYIAGYFEYTLGGRTQFAGMFDGSDKLPQSVASFADVRTVAQQPASRREDVATFTSSANIETTPAATATVCANMFGRTVPEQLPVCTDPNSELSFGQLPYWSGAVDAPNVPLNPMTHLKWTEPTGALTVSVPAGQRNVSSFAEMTVSMSPDESVPTGTGTDLTLTVTDSKGHSWHELASRLNPWSVTRMPASDSDILGKIVPQQVHVPTAALAKAGLDLRNIASVTFAAAVGTDGSASGGEYLSDLMFDSKGLGTPAVRTRASVNIAPTSVEEGDTPGTDHVAVYLSQPSDVPVTAFLTLPVLPFTGPPTGTPAPTGQLGEALRKVTFPAGTTCQAVDIPANGDETVGTSAITAYTVGLSDTADSVLGLHAFGTVSVREDDGTPSAPPVGIQGDVCAEHEALAHPGNLQVDDRTPTRGSAITVQGSSFRNGESVAFTLGSTELGSALAGRDGTVSFRAVIPANQVTGSAGLTAVGAGSGFIETASIRVQAH